MNPIKLKKAAKLWRAGKITRWASSDTGHGVGCGPYVLLWVEDKQYVCFAAYYHLMDEVREQERQECEQKQRMESEKI